MLPHLEVHGSQKTFEISPAVDLKRILVPDLKTTILKSKTIDEGQAIVNRRIDRLLEKIERRQLIDQGSNRGKAIHHSGLRLAIAGIHKRTEQMCESRHAQRPESLFLDDDEGKPSGEIIALLDLNLRKAAPSCGLEPPMFVEQGRLGQVLVGILHSGAPATFDILLLGPLIRGGALETNAMRHNKIECSMNNT